MIDIVKLNTKKTRSFGWVQDSGNLNSLCDVVSVFDETSNFHKNLVETIIPKIVQDKTVRENIIASLSSNPLSLNYKILVGGHITPRENSPCDGIIQAAVKGQKRDYIGDWPADNFLRWTHALGFVSYNYNDDTFSITENGKLLVSAVESNNEKTKNEILIQAVLSYPPAFRILQLLQNPADILTKFELGKKLGFAGEDGFISYPLESIVAALSSTSDAKERSDIRSNWESSSDKYARTISQWLVSLGLLENAKKEIALQYGDKFVSAPLGGYKITPQGQRYFRNASGNSRHKKNEKIVFYEMFATKGKDREYLRLRRSLVLKFLAEKKKRCQFTEIADFLKKYGLQEFSETIKDDVLGFINIGLTLDVDENGAELKDKTSDFSIPIYKNLTNKSEISEIKNDARKKLKNISHEYLSLLDLAFDSKQNRLFEIKTMELFIKECGFFGEHLGGANKPDGIIFTDNQAKNYGIIVDTKAYSKGYALPVSQRDEMLRYIRENIDRDKKFNSTQWWKKFPQSLGKFYFMFVSGVFKGDIADKLNKISLVHNVNGTAMPILTALLVADKMKSGDMTTSDFENGICNAEYKIFLEKE